MRDPDHNWTLAATGGSRAWQHRPSPWWRLALNALRPPVWPAIVATLMVLGLLMVFQQVVAQSVAQGDQRRTATAVQVKSIWRCNLLRDAGARDNCLVKVGGAPERISLHDRENSFLTPMEK